MFRWIYASTVLPNGNPYGNLVVNGPNQLFGYRKQRVHAHPIKALRLTFTYAALTPASPLPRPQPPSC
jgi:hypothetical protein